MYKTKEKITIVLSCHIMKTCSKLIKIKLIGWKTDLRMISNLLTTSVNVRYHDTRIKSIKYMSLNSITSKIESTFSVMVIALLKYGPFFH